jgi:hypothetical protein
VPAQEGDTQQTSAIAVTEWQALDCSPKASRKNLLYGVWLRRKK